MGFDSFEAQEERLNLQHVQVHSGMCEELVRLVDIVSSVLPQIEAARPGGVVGIQALSLLQKTNERARQHVRNCCDSSKLYLAMTGDAIVKRFVKTRNLFVQSLSRLQGMVPVALASQISDVLDDLQAVVFFMDSHEELAGKVLRALLEGSASPINSIGNSMLELLQFAAAVLHISSKKDILLEHRSLKKMLGKTNEGDSKKRETLIYLMRILKKYDNKIVQGHPRDHWIQNGQTCLSLKSESESTTTVTPDITFRPDRVVNPSLAIPELSSLDISSNSMWSMASSLKDLHLRADFSSTSLGSFDSSYNTIYHSELGDNFYSYKEASDVDARKLQFYRSNDDINSQFLSAVGELPWESQCRAIQDVYNYLICYNPSCSFVSTENFLDPLLRFLHNALDKQDVEAQKSGSQLLLTFLRASRTDKSQLGTGFYVLMASFLATETSLVTLAIIEVLSTEAGAISRLNVSGVLNRIIKLLDSCDRDILQAALRILHNLSLSISASSCTLASEWIPKLAHLMGDGSVAATCVVILENLCKYEEIRVAITKTEDCIASIIKLLESNCSDTTQEKAIGILLPLCSQRDSCSLLVLHVGGIPALVHVSNTGNDKVKSEASELLRQLRYVKYEPEQEIQACPVVEVNASEDRPQNSETKPTKTSHSLIKWFFRKKK